MNGLSRNNSLLLLLISVIAGLIFIPFIGNCPLFDWDEVNFAECAREMVVSGNYSEVQLNFKPFWEKPPFFIWLQALSMNVFGVNEFAARFPNALCSIATLISIFLIGKKIHSQKFGLVWCLLYVATLLPHFYFKSGIIDPWYNLFIFLSIYHSFRFLNNPSGKKEIFNALLAGLFLGLAVLTKGPVALIISGLTIVSYLVWNRQFKTLGKSVFILFVLATLLIGGSWFLIEWLKGNGHIIREFIDYQIRLYETGDSGHDGPFFYHLIVLLVGCFPSSILFLIYYLKRIGLTPFQREARKVFLILFWVVLILFSVVKTKIVHYSSLCYFPLTFIAALGLVNDFDQTKLNTLVKTLFWLCAGLLSLAFTAIGFIDNFKPALIKNNLIDDEFAVQNLQADVHWSGFEFLTGLVLFTASLLIYMALVRKNQRLLYVGLVTQIFFIELAIALLVPKIELYSQHAAIEFYRECSKHNCYIETTNFKSYAYIFYSNRMPGDYRNPDQLRYIEEHLDLMETQGFTRLSGFATSNAQWLENGKIDRPAYLVCKTKDEGLLTKNPEMHKLYQKNGFSFFVRMPLKHDK